MIILLFKKLECDIKIKSDNGKIEEYNIKGFLRKNVG